MVLEKNILHLLIALLVTVHVSTRITYYTELKTWQFQFTDEQKWRLATVPSTLT